MEQSCCFFRRNSTNTHECQMGNGSPACQKLYLKIEEPDYCSTENGNTLNIPSSTFILSSKILKKLEKSVERLGWKSPVTKQSVTYSGTSFEREYHFICFCRICPSKCSFTHMQVVTVQGQVSGHRIDLKELNKVFPSLCAQSSNRKGQTE